MKAKLTPAQRALLSDAESCAGRRYLRDRFLRRAGNNLEAKGLGRVVWPGPHFDINDAGRAWLAAQEKKP